MTICWVSAEKHISRKDWKLPVVHVPTHTLKFNHEGLAKYLVAPNATAQQTSAATKVKAWHDLLTGPAEDDEITPP
jgi:hypothetical protein